MPRAFQILSNLIVLYALSSGALADDITTLKCKYHQATVLTKGKANLRDTSIEKSMRIIISDDRPKVYIDISGTQLCNKLHGVADDLKINAWCDKYDGTGKVTHVVTIDRVTGAIEKELLSDDKPVFFYEGKCSVSKKLF